MKTGTFLSILLFAGTPAWSATTAPGPAAKPLAQERKALKLGAVVFEAPASMSAFNIKGTAKTIEGYAVFEGPKINELQVKIPVESLETGMSLRNKHMREKIFQTADGKLPDVVLTASAISCAPSGADMLCPVAGELEIRGVKKPFSSQILLTQAGSGRKATGQAVVKLSDYGIAQPEQLGVKVSNEVKLNLELLVD